MNCKINMSVFCKKLLLVLLLLSINVRYITAKEEMKYYAAPEAESKAITASLMGFTAFQNPTTPPTLYTKLSGFGEYGGITASSSQPSSKWRYDLDSSASAQWVFANGGPQMILGVAPYGTLPLGDTAWDCSSVIPNVATSGESEFYAPFGGHLTTVSSTMSVGSGECYGASGGNVLAKNSTYWILSDPDTEESARDRAVPFIYNDYTTYWYPRVGNAHTWSEQKASFVGKFPDACADKDYILHYRLRKRSLPSGSYTYEKKKQTIKLTESHETPRIDLPFDQGMEYALAPLDGDYGLPVLGLELVDDCGCDDMAGDGNASLPTHSSVHWDVFLSREVDGRLGAILRLNADDITADIYAPSALELITFPNHTVQIISDANGFRQSLSVDKIVDRVINSDGYELRFYRLADVQLAGSALPYAITGEAAEIWRIRNPDGAGTADRVQFERVSGTKTVVSEFRQDHVSGKWTLIEGNGLKTTTWTNTTDSVTGRRVEVETVKGADGIAVSVIRREFSLYGDSEKLAIISRDPDGADLWESFEYNGIHGQLSYSERWDGFKQSFGYDSSGALSYKDYTRFNNDWSGSEYRYNTWAPYDVDNDGKSDRQVTIYTYPDSRERHEVVLSQTVSMPQGQCQERWHVTPIGAGGNWSQSDYSVVKERSLISGPHAGRVIWRLLTDGRLELTTFSAAINGDPIETVEVGAPNVAMDGVNAGTRTITIFTSAGIEQSRLVEDILTNNLISSSVVTQFDSRGKAIKILHLDGFEEEYGYNPCCGKLISHKTRNGTKMFDYDDLGRLVLETSDGIDIRTTYDAAGRAIKTERIGADASVQVLSSYTYDVAGRRTSETDAAGRIVVLSEEKDSFGFIKATRTFVADNSTIWQQSYTDGTLYQSGGDAGRATRYLEGPGADGTWVRRTILLAINDGAEEWSEEVYDRAGRIVERRYPDEAAEYFYYNNQNQMVRQTDADGVQTLYSYNALGERTISALDLDIDQEGSIEYDGVDRVTRTTAVVADKSGTTVRRTTTEVWAVNGTDAATTVGVLEVSADNLQTWQTVHGLTTYIVTAYNGTGGRTETTTLPDASSVVRTYVAARLISEVRKDASSLTLSETTYAYDNHRRLALQTVTGIGATTYTYYADDQIASVTTPDPDPSRSGNGYDPQTTSYTYNARGWQSKITQPDGAETHAIYYPTGQVKRTWGGRSYPVEHTYDIQGRMKTIKTWKDFAGTSGEAVTTWHYDAQRGWLTGKRYADNQGPDYTYTGAGRLATRTWARGVVTTYAYNHAGDLSGVTYSDSTPAVIMTYDRLGRPHTTTDAAGLLTRGYMHGRLTGEVYIGEGLLSGQSVVRTLDNLNRLSSLDFGSSTLTYAYDDASRLRSITQESLSATYGYHPSQGGVTSVIVKNGVTERVRQERTLDRLGRIARVDTLGNGATLHARRDYTYNNANQRTRVEHEDARRWAYGYDPLGQLISAEKRLADDTTVLPGYAFGYNFDDIGNRIGTITNGRSAAYTVDLLNRYTQRDVPGAVDVRGATPNGIAVLVNDALAVRTGADFYRGVPVDNTTEPVHTEIKVQAVGVGPPEQVATETRHAFVPKTPEVFTYDVDGNLMSDGRWTYAWDGENRLISMETVNGVITVLPALKRRLEFAYDGQSRRIGKVVKTWNNILSEWETTDKRRFLYDGWTLLAEELWSTSTSTYALHSSYVWGLDLSGSSQGAGGVGGLLWTNTDTSTHAAGYDANGNIIVWVNCANGLLDGAHEYGAFGELVLSTGLSGELAFGFSTKYRDKETGMFYYGFRYYNPSTGRWLSRDPIEEEGGVNLYAMVNNDPVNSWDYLGLKECCDSKTLDEGERWLNDRFKAASSDAKKRGLKPRLPGGIPSCKTSSSDIGEWFLPTPKCWTCHTELRRKKPIGDASSDADHQVIICKATDDSGKDRERIFDWWGDNLWPLSKKTSGGSPDDFRRIFPYHVVSYPLIQTTGCDGGVTPANYTPDLNWTGSVNHF